MKIRGMIFLLAAAMLALTVSLEGTVAAAETIDPNDDGSQFAWSENGGGGISGYAWGENTGWISFSCDNTASCGTVEYRVTINPSSGKFGGHAWSENIGWISFSCENTSSCGAEDYGVTTSWRASVGGATSFLADRPGRPAGTIDVLVGATAAAFAILLGGSWYARRRRKLVG